MRRVEQRESIRVFVDEFPFREGETLSSYARRVADHFGKAGHEVVGVQGAASYVRKRTIGQRTPEHLVAEELVEVELVSWLEPACAGAGEGEKLDQP